MGGPRYGGLDRHGPPHPGRPLRHDVGFGPDPTSSSFGARVFTAGEAGHSGYFTPGSTSLENLAHITLGARAEVSRA